MVGDGGQTGRRPDDIVARLLARGSNLVFTPDSNVISSFSPACLKRFGVFSHTTTGKDRQRSTSLILVDDIKKQKSRTLGSSVSSIVKIETGITMKIAIAFVAACVASASAFIPLKVQNTPVSKDGPRYSLLDPSS
jgi:hypothetical protein